VTGSTIEVATLKFKVQSGATAAVHTSALSFTVTQMVNQYSIAFLSGTAGRVNDERGGVQTSGQLTVAALGYAGVFAYAPLNELVNLAPLTGADVSTDVLAVAVYDHAGQANALTSSGVSCSLADPPVGSFVLSGCTVYAGADHINGTSGTIIGVNLGDLSANFTLRVWAPHSITLNVSDVELGLVSSPHTHHHLPYTRIDVSYLTRISNRRPRLSRASSREIPT
jgi:hypothetical protein